VKSKFAMAGLLSVSLVLSGSLAYAQGPAELPRPMQKRPSIPEGPITKPTKPPLAISVKECVAIGGTTKLDTVGGCSNGLRCVGRKADGGSYSLCITSL